MLKLLTCAQGHYWEKPDENGTPDHCPVCGQPPEAMPLLDLLPSQQESDSPAPPPSALSLRDKGGRPFIAGYEIREDLGKGPTGILHFKARQVLVNRVVVLKVVFAKDDPGQFTWGSLRGEANALGRLAHPNIVRIFDAGERERQMFYNAVEFIEGPTLAEVRSGKPLPLPQVVALIDTLARAVHYAHQNNILHRNLKPSNIRLANGVTDTHSLLNAIPKITEFGLARRPVEGEAIDSELQGELPCYLAPEQAWGRAKEIGPATDVYALGAILYELIAGRPPFREATAAETLDSIQYREPPPLSQMRRGVPSDLDAICRKCMAKQPRRRYGSALDLAEDLRRCASGHSIRARIASNPERLGKWLRRNVRGLTLVLLGLVLGAVLAGLKHRDRGTRGARRDDGNDQRTMSRLKIELAEAHRQKREVDYHRYLLLAERAVKTGENIKDSELLDRCPEEMRHWEWHYLHNYLRDFKLGLQNSNVWRSVQIESPIACMDFSRDGQYLAVGVGQDQSHEGRESKPEVWVWNVVMGVRLWRWQMPGPVRSVAFDPDTTSLTILSDGTQGGKATLEVRLLDTGRLLFPTKTLAECQPAAVAYSLVSKYLLVIAKDSTIRFLQANSGVEDGRTEKLCSDKGIGTHTKFLPIPTSNGFERLALLSPDGREIRLVPDPWTPLSFTVLRDNEDQIYRAVAYDPPYKKLAAGGMAKTIALWDISSPQHPPRILRGHEGRITGLAFSRDGKRLASCGSDSTVRIWDVEQNLELLTLRGYNDATGVQFQHFQFGWGEMGPRSLDALAVAHGDKVTLLAPR